MKLQAKQNVSFILYYQLSSENSEINEWLGSCSRQVFISLDPILISISL